MSLLQDLRYGVRCFGRRRGFTARRARVAGARHRREHGRLQPLQRGAAPPRACRARAGENRLAAPRPRPTRTIRITGSSRAASTGWPRPRARASSASRARAASPSCCAASSSRLTTSTCSASGPPRAEPSPKKMDARSAPVVVISQDLWRTRFGSDPSIVGRQISLNGLGFTVVGVAPPNFTGTEAGMARELWVPLSMEPVLNPRAADPQTGVREPDVLHSRRNHSARSPRAP